MIFKKFNNEFNFDRKIVYFVLNCSNKSFSSIAQQNSPQVVRKYRATRNFLQVYFLTLSHHANEVKANLHYETHHFGVTT